MVALLCALPMPGVIMGENWCSESHRTDGVPVVFVVPFVLATVGGLEAFARLRNREVDNLLHQLLYD
jgi:hypothetical protein